MSIYQAVGVADGVGIDENDVILRSLDGDVRIADLWAIRLASIKNKGGV